jgi:hypothetical protein
MASGLPQSLPVSETRSLLTSWVTKTPSESFGGNGVVPSGLTWDIDTLRHKGTTQVTVTP